ncbi:MAG: aldo/keto reductase [Pseudonocardiaceae bacterium]
MARRPGAKSTYSAVRTAWPGDRRRSARPSPQAQVREFDARHGIATQAWSPLAHGQLTSDPTVGAVAARHGRTAAQVLLRWNLELGNIVISKSVTPERIRSNIQVFDFELTSDDHAALATLDTGARTGPDPDVYGA